MLFIYDYTWTIMDNFFDVDFPFFFRAFHKKQIHGPPRNVWSTPFLEQKCRRRPQGLHIDESKQLLGFLTRHGRERIGV